jgi:hypothetical protein
MNRACCISVVLGIRLGWRIAIYPFERFTERAKRVLMLAQEEAERSHHSYIGTEHVLLGLIREHDGLAALVLANLGIEIGQVRQTIESVLHGNERTLLQAIIPTSRVKKVIEISFEESRRMGTNFVGTEHMLLGLIIEGDSIAAHVLEDLGATLERVRSELERQLLAGTQEAAPELPTYYKVGDRVLVHDPNPPYRLWEGRVAKAEEPLIEVSVPSRPAGELVSTESKLIHKIPMSWSRDCEFCRAG